MSRASATERPSDAVYIDSSVGFETEVFLSLKRSSERLDTLSVTRPNLRCLIYTFTVSPLNYTEYISYPYSDRHECPSLISTSATFITVKAKDFALNEMAEVEVNRVYLIVL